MFRVLLLLTLAAVCTQGASVPGFRRGLAPTLDGRIVGGVPTTIADNPHQISMKYFGSHRCGGSIHKSHVIVTAAHCVNGIPPEYLIVLAGTTSRYEGGIEHIVKSVIQHQDFDPLEFINDVALLILEKQLTFTDLVQPIALASRGEKLRAGTKAYVSGWGTLTESGSAPANLQQVAVTIVSNEECAKAYEGENPVTDSMLCAGEPTGGRDACQGDSGGPLTVASKLYGIVSWGIGCARKNYPGVYADVGHLREWIEMKMLIAPFAK